MYTELFRRNLKQSRISIHFLCDLVLFCVISLLRLSSADVLRPKVWLLTLSFSFFMFKVLSKEDRSLVVGVDKYPLNRAIKLATLEERPLRALCWTWSLLHLLWSLLVGYSPHSCQPLRENISSVTPHKNGKKLSEATSLDAIWKDV